ncbi:MAG: lactate utilization protein C [Alphaproteobacteria bacterium]|nr:lactate utilization protein C [Alphaproteobacteria bacterium]
MSEANRGAILAALGAGLGRVPSPGLKAEIEARIDRPRRNLEPKRANLGPAGQRDLLLAKLGALAVSVDRVAPDQVAAAVAAWIARHNLPAEAVLAPDPALDECGWERTALSLRRGRAQDRDQVSVVPGFAAVAETGTLMLLSGAERPTTLNFMPDNHVVVLRASDVVGTLEDAFEKLRRARKAAGRDDLPRTVNLISGPSRTADVDQTIVMGAHGPRRLHVVLIEDRPDGGA